MSVRSSVVIALVGAWISATARAAPDDSARGLALGADAGVVVPVLNPLLDQPTVSYGFDGRLGWRVKAGPVFVQPEAVIGVQSYESANSSQRLGRGMLGARVGLRGLFQPHLMTHVGYGGTGTGSGFVYDVGVGLDLHAPHVAVGLDLTFNGLLAQNYKLTSIGFGPGLTVLF